VVIMVILSKVSFCVLKWLNSAHSLILFEATFIEVFMSIRLEGRFQVCTGNNGARHFNAYPVSYNDTIRLLCIFS